MNRSPIIAESFTARWERRAITIPVYLGLGLVSVALLPVSVLMALVIDAVRRTGHLVTVRCALGLTLYFACEAVGLVACGLIWIASGVWAGANRERFVDWNLVLQRLWARALFGGAPASGAGSGASVAPPSTAGSVRC